MTENTGYIAAIGMFDGVHVGHQRMLSAMAASGASAGFEPMVVTFDRHPLETIAPSRAPLLLTSLPEREELLRRCSTERVVVLPFDEEMRRKTAREFMTMLRDRFNVKAIFMGYDHHFGSDRLRSVDDYRRIAAELGLEIVLGQEKTTDSGAHVSSSAVRRLLQQGDITAANEALGRPYRLTGTVVHGHQLGRRLGFPTANLEVDPRRLIPAPGVYACRATLPDGRSFPAMVNIGSRPTVTDSDSISSTLCRDSIICCPPSASLDKSRTIEANILDFSGDLYGLPLTLDFLGRLRDERRFPSLDALSAQLAKDADDVRRIVR